MLANNKFFYYVILCKKEKFNGTQARVTYYRTFHQLYNIVGLFIIDGARGVTGGGGRPPRFFLKISYYIYILKNSTLLN